jgi:hypothetical protein
LLIDNQLLPYFGKREAGMMAMENKMLKQLNSVLEECRLYQCRLYEFADRQIDLDDVVKNYATFAPVLAKLK